MRKRYTYDHSSSKLPAWLDWSRSPHRSVSRAKYPSSSGLPRYQRFNGHSMVMMTKKSRSWGFSRILSLGFHGSISAFKSERQVAKHHTAVLSARSKSATHKKWHAIRTFFAR